MNSSGEKQVEKFADIVEDFDHAMLVTKTESDDLHARPMAIADHDGTRLVFATSNTSAKAREMALHPRVAVTMQANDAYLAVYGKAAIIRDPARIAPLWRSSWRLWFPEGPSDPRLVLVEVEPDWAEYWDRTGTRRLEFLWEAGKALATGRKVDDQALAGHQTFDFK